MLPPMKGLAAAGIASATATHHPLLTTSTAAAPSSWPIRRSQPPGPSRR